MTTTPQPLQPTEMPQENFVEDIDSVIMEWYAAHQQLEELKAREAKLRKQIDCSHLFDQQKSKGTQKHGLGHGYEIKTVRQEYVKVENKNNEAFQAIVALRNLGVVEAERADKIFRFTPSLSETTYKEMTPAEKAIVDPLVTRTRGSAKLTLVEPKGE